MASYILWRLQWLHKIWLPYKNVHSFQKKVWKIEEKFYWISLGLFVWTQPACTFIFLPVPMHVTPGLVCKMYILRKGRWQQTAAHRFVGLLQPLVCTSWSACACHQCQLFTIHVLMSFMHITTLPVYILAVPSSSRRMQYLAFSFSRRRFRPVSVIPQLHVH